MSEANEVAALEQDQLKKIFIGPKEVTIPHDWDTAKLSEIAREGDKTFVDGDWVESSDMVPNGEYQLIQLGNIGEGNFKGECDKFVSEEFFNKKNCTLVEQGDLLISRLADPVLRTIIVPEFEKRSITAVDIVVAKVDEENWSKEYIYQLLNSKPLADAGGSLATGSTRQRISRSNMAKITIPRPPLAEQQRIADILSTVDEQIQQTDEIINETQNLKRGLVKQLLTHGIDNQEYKTAHFGPLGVDIPVEWDLSPLKQVTKQITDGVHTTPDYVDDGIPFLSTKNVNPFRSEFDTSSYEKYISTENHDELVKKAHPEKGDIIIARRATIGPAQLVRTESEFSIFVGLGLIKLTQEIDGRFLEQFFNWNKIQQILNLKSPGSTMKTLNLGTLRNQIIPIPPLNEQRKIADILSSVDDKIHQEQNTKQDLQELKCGLMQDLLIGRKRVDPK